MNDELFGPHGLYCLIMAYDINSRSNVVQFDLGTEHNAAPGPVSPPETPIEAGHSQARFRAHDGILGAAQFPVSAELVFFDPRNEPPPAYEDTDSDDSKYGGVSAAPSVNGNGFWKKLANTAASLQTRQDLKAQVKFVSQGPPSPMRFHMILADFNQYTLPLIQQKKNPTSLISSLLDPKAELNSKDIKKQQKREAKQERKSEKQERKAEKRQRKHPDREPKERKIKSVSQSLLHICLPFCSATRTMHALTNRASLKGILYLMIVNMPSGDAMNEAQDILGAEAMQPGDEDSCGR